MKANTPDDQNEAAASAPTNPPPPDGSGCGCAAEPKGKALAAAEFKKFVKENHIPPEVAEVMQSAIFGSPAARDEMHKHLIITTSILLAVERDRISKRDACELLGYNREQLRAMRDQIVNNIAEGSKTKLKALRKG